MIRYTFSSPPRVAPWEIAHSYVWCLMALHIFTILAIEMKPVSKARENQKKTYETQVHQDALAMTNSLKVNYRMQRASFERNTTNVNLMVQSHWTRTVSLYRQTNPTKNIYVYWVLYLINETLEEVYHFIPPRVAPWEIVHSYVWCLMALHIFTMMRLKWNPFPKPGKTKTAYEITSTSRCHHDDWFPRRT